MIDRTHCNSSNTCFCAIPAQAGIQEIRQRAGLVSGKNGDKVLLTFDCPPPSRGTAIEGCPDNC